MKKSNKVKKIVKPKSIVRLPQYTVKKVVHSLSETMNWGMTMLNVPDTWKTTQGEDITVCIIDTGMPNHIDLNDSLIKDKCLSFAIGEKDINDKNYHGCVAPNTLIHTNLNGIEYIEDLYNSLNLNEINEPGENDLLNYKKDVTLLNLKTYSIDENGDVNINKITYLHKTQIQCEDVIKITLQGDIEYILTPWHKVPVLRDGKIQKIRADEIKESDNFLFPQTPNDLSKEYFIQETQDCLICPNCGYKITHLRDRRNISYRCFKCGIYSKKWEQSIIKHVINEDLAYLIGLVITDGYINYFNGSKYCVEISSCTPEILQKASQISENYGFGKGSLYFQNNGTNQVLKINSKELVILLLNCGVLHKRKSYDQTMPSFIGKSPYSVICSFLAGVIDGDGCISKNFTLNRITSVSLKWIRQLHCLFNSIGVNASYYKNNNIGFNKQINPIVPFVYNCQFSKIPVEIINHIVHPIKKQRCLDGLNNENAKSTRKYRKIREIKKDGYNGYFYDFTVENDHTYIANGHFVSNTHCAGIVGARQNGFGVIGVAPKCNIVTLKVLRQDGSGSTDNVNNALRYCINELKPDIISMSLGSSESDSEMHDLIKQLHDLNIPVFAAAGNDGFGNPINFPGAYPEVICVGAIDEDGNAASFESTGPEMEMVAPGVDIYSTYGVNNYALLSGSSMSCPFAAGVCALLLAKHHKQEEETGFNDCKTVEQIKQHFKKYTIAGKGPTDKYGWGVVPTGDLINEKEESPPAIIPEVPQIPATKEKKSWWKKFLAFFGL